MFLCVVKIRVLARCAEFQGWWGRPCLNLAGPLQTPGVRIMVCVHQRTVCNVRAWLDVRFVRYNERHYYVFLLILFYAELTIWLSGGDQGWVILFGSYPSVCFAPTRRGCVCLVCWTTLFYFIFESKGWKKAKKLNQINVVLEDNINVGVIAQTDKIFFPFFSFFFLAPLDEKRNEGVTVGPRGYRLMPSHF